MHRELTPEDYDLLKVLDESNQKKTVAKDVIGDKMTTVKPLPDAECGVCLGAFEDEDAKCLPCCSAQFHESCLRKWLEGYKNSCPHCVTELA